MFILRWVASLNLIIIVWGRGIGEVFPIDLGKPNSWASFHDRWWQGLASWDFPRRISGRKGIHFVEKGMVGVLLQELGGLECPLRRCYCNVEAKKEKCLSELRWRLWVSSWPLSMEANRMGEAILSVCFKLYSVVYLDFHWHSGETTLMDSTETTKNNRLMSKWLSSLFHLKWKNHLSTWNFLLWVTAFFCLFLTLAIYKFVMTLQSYLLPHSYWLYHFFCFLKPCGIIIIIILLFQRIILICHSENQRPSSC